MQVEMTLGNTRILKSFMLVALFIIGAGACNAASGTSTPAPSRGDVLLEDCQLTAPGIDLQVSASCGTVEVFENRQAESGRTIDLQIAILEANSRTPAPDPLFILTGGPGQAATEAYLTLASAFSRVRSERDIVLVDQRGTGGSNRLQCDFPQEVETDPNAQIAPLLEACLGTLEADLTQYTTTAAMQDLDQVREHLGYDQINLYGVSYGSRAALVYMRLFPERVRSVILDGLAPPQIALGLDMAADAQRAWDQIVERCMDQAGCAGAFPDIEVTFNSLLARLETEPLLISMSHPVSGEQMEVELTAEMVAMVVRFHSYAPETAALLPLLIHTAQVEGVFEPLAAQFYLNAGTLEASIANAMSYSVMCTEDVPFYEDAQPVKDTFLGSTLVDGFREICRVWPAGEAPPDFQQPVYSEAPVLLLSGEVDPVTPPKYADLAAETLPNSLHVIAPGMGHNVVGRGCLPNLVAEFLVTGETAGLDTGCVDRIQPFPFFINFSGPLP